LLAQVELCGEGLDLGRLDVAAILRAFDDRADLIRLEQFLELVLRQGSLSPFSRASKRSAFLL
jgi:hypothetical protein